VGKSALTLRYISDEYAEEYDPTIEDSYRKMVEIDDKSIIVDILDTAGPEEYASLQDQWIREADGYIFCVSPDVTDSCEYMDHKLESARKLVGADTDEVLAMCIAANKSDLDYRKNHKPMVEKLEDLAHRWGTKVIFNSSKERYNTHEVFAHVVREWRKPKWQRGAWPYNVGFSNYWALYSTVIEGLQDLDFSDELIEEIVSTVFSVDFVKRAQQSQSENLKLPSKKKKRCSIM